MSNDAMTLAWKAADAPEKPGPMFVLIVLADHGSDAMGEDFKAYPSIKRIMQRTKFERSACEGHLKTLVTLGWISRRRRIKPDGNKGLYDYELHREAEFRARMRAARATIVAAGLKPSGEVDDLRHPCLSGACVNSEHAPCVNSDDGMREKHENACVKSEHLEPSEEPSIEPPPGARALRAKFDELVEAVPKRVIKFSDLERAAWPWFVRVVEGGVHPDVLVGCGRRMALDPEVKARRYLSPLQDWLSEGQWRGWLADPELALPEPDAEAEAEPQHCAAPGEVAIWLPVMAEMQTVMGAGPFGSYLGHAVLGQVGEDLFVVAANGIARDWLRNNRWGDLQAAWRRRDPAARDLRLIIKSEFEALLRQAGSEG